MSTASEREAALRRALHSAAEYIEPAPGGLERIQERLRRPRPLLFAQLEAVWAVVLMRAPDVIEAVRWRVAKVVRLVWDRFGPKPAAGNGPLRWLRPLTAMCVAVFVVGASVYVGLANPLPLPLPGALQGGGGGVTGSHPGGRAGSSGGTLYGKGTQTSNPTAESSSGSTSACPTSTPRFQRPPRGQSSTPASKSTTPATSTGPSTSSPPTSSSTSPSPTPNPGSSTPSSADSAAAPNGATSGDPALAGAHTGRSHTGVSGSSARRNAGTAPSPATSGRDVPASDTQKYNPCHPPKQKSKAKKTSTAGLTSVQLTQAQPGRAVAANLD